jgi:hypothetical protein
VIEGGELSANFQLAGNEAAIKNQYGANKRLWQVIRISNSIP